MEKTVNNPVPGTDESQSPDDESNVNQSTECCGDETACDTDAAATGDNQDGQREPCPTPLVWEQVLDIFRDESHPWEIHRDGRKISGRTWFPVGKDDNRPPEQPHTLYFLNGLTGNCDQFALTAYLLRDEFRCVLFDYPECATETKEAQLPLQEFADDLFAIAEQHEDETLSIVGTSFGSAVGLAAMAFENGQSSQCSITSAVLHAGFARRELSFFERLATRCGTKSRRNLRDVPLRRLFQTQNHRPWFPPFDFTRWEFFLENSGDTPVAAMASRAAELKSLDVRDQLPNILQPCLLIRGEGEGQVLAGHHVELEAGLPNSRTEWMHSTGQLPFITHPHRFVKLIRGFVHEQVSQGEHKTWKTGRLT